MRNLTEFGAFVEITEDIDGLIHVSDMSWTKRVKHPSEVLKKGDVVKARITNIDVQNQRVSLSIKEFLPNEWDSFVNKYHVGDTVDGKVVNVTDFGLFIDIFEGLEGLAHISEIDLPGGRLEDRFRVGEWVSARILRIEEDEKKVGLTMRGVPQPTMDEIAQLDGTGGEEASEESGDGDTAEEASTEMTAMEEALEAAAEVVAAKTAAAEEAAADEDAPSEDESSDEEASDDDADEAKASEEEE